MKYKDIKKLFSRYLNDRSGVNAIIFAFVMPAMVAAGGMALDLANAYNVRNKLAQALDKAALAAANTAGNDDLVRARAENFVQANFRTDGLGELINTEVLFGSNTLTVNASARVDTMLMRLFGHNYFTVNASSEVTRELSGVEVVLVLDVTGSMAGPNIIALRSAARLFVNKLFEEVSDDNLIRIGIVPYSASVNVGSYGWGQDMNGNYYAQPFVVPPQTDTYITPSSIEYNTNDPNQWHGCVLSQPYPDDTLDNTTAGFGMYRYPRRCTLSLFGHCLQYQGHPNMNCPQTPIIPLTNDQDRLLDTIDDLSPGGSTLGNVGMVWGWRVISPTPPFTEGREYDDPRWKKAVIMMTDGENFMDGWYSAYGLTSTHNINVHDLDERFEEVCNHMKALDITIYTITFQSLVGPATRAYYERCATTPEMFAHAPDNATLENIFEDIANQLSRLHLSR